MQKYKRLVIAFLFPWIVMVLAGCAALQPQAPLLAARKNVKTALVFANSVSSDHAREALRKANQRLGTQTNIWLEPVYETSLDYEMQLTTSGQLLNGWKKLLWEHEGLRQDIVIIFLPQSYLRHRLVKEVRGLSDGIGTSQRFESAVTYVGISGKIEQDSLVILHEVGHLLGAAHSAEGIMRPDDLFLSRDDRFSRESLKEISDALSQPPLNTPLACIGFQSYAPRT